MSVDTQPPDHGGISIVGPEPVPPGRSPARPSDSGGRSENSPRPDQPLRSPGLAQALDTFTAAAAAVATVSHREASTSALPEQVDLVADLGELARAVLDHNQRVLMGDDADWASLAEQLADAAARCRHQVVIHVTDIGDSGCR